MNQTNSRPGFLNVLCGGTPNAASPALADFLGDTDPYRVLQLGVDTDPASAAVFTPRSEADQFVPIPLTRQKVSALTDTCYDEGNERGDP